MTRVTLARFDLRIVHAFIYVAHMNNDSKAITAKIRQQIADTPGITVTRAAAEIGVDRSTLSTQLSAGTIRLSEFLALASVLETNPADYLGQDAPAQRTAA